VVERERKDAIERTSERSKRIGDEWSEKPFVFPFFLIFDPLRLGVWDCASYFIIGHKIILWPMRARVSRHLTEFSRRGLATQDAPLFAPPPLFESQQAKAYNV
jgi:hypothetical protein